MDATVLKVKCWICYLMQIPHKNMFYLFQTPLAIYITKLTASIKM